MGNGEDAVKEKLAGAGFEVVDEIEIGDLSDVKEERNILPPVKGIKVRIRKVTINQNKEGTFRQLNMSLAVEDGFEVAGEVKYKGSVIWARVPYYADSQVYTKDYFVKKQHLVELKKLALALSIDITDIKVNDEFLASLEGQLLTADVRQRASQYVIRNGKKITLNKEVKALGDEQTFDDVQNEVGNFKAISSEAQV